MRFRVLLVSAALVAGCNGGDGAEPKPKPKPRTSDAAVIRGWSDAINAGRYERAARFFARGAIVDQGAPVRLRTRAAAVAFNRSLPCRATVTEVRAKGKTTIATFRLRAGPSKRRQGCEADVRVSFTIRKGKFTVFRQLPGDARPGGSLTRIDNGA